MGNKKVGTYKCGACPQCSFISNKSEIYIPSRRRCITAKGYSNCDSKGLVYMALCGQCEGFYVGKMEKSLKRRIYEHNYDIKKGNNRNALYKHTQLCKEASFTFFVLGEVQMDVRGGPWETQIECREVYWQLVMEANKWPSLNEMVSLAPVLK